MARLRLFPDEPVAELRGLSSLTDPDAAGGVIDVAVFGARGDGKTQFIVHAIRTLRAHAPTLGDGERALNREVLRVVMDPRAPRPEATPPGFVPHYTFRVRPGSLLARLRGLGALRLLWRASPQAIALGAVAFLAALAALASLGSAPSAAVGGLGAGLFATAALCGWMASKKLRHAEELEVAFWDIAGEHVYSASAADYYSLLAALIEKRKQRAAELGRPYAFAPVLLCNPIALGTRSAGSPFERLRQLLPLFAAIDDQGGRALIAVNRWSVVDPICARGELRDEIVEVTARALGEERGEAKLVARDVVRRHCLDTEDGRDGDVVISHLRYDTALRCSVEKAELAAREGGKSGEGGERGESGESGAAGEQSGEREDERATAALVYKYDEGPGAFSGESASRFLDWLMRGLRHPVTAPAIKKVKPAEGISPPRPSEPIVEGAARPLGSVAPAAREPAEAVRRTSPRLTPSPSRDADYAPGAARERLPELGAGLGAGLASDRGRELGASLGSGRGSDLDSGVASDLGAELGGGVGSVASALEPVPGMGAEIWARPGPRPAEPGGAR